MPLLMMISNLTFLCRKFVYDGVHDKNVSLSVDRIDGEFNAKVVDAIVQAIGTEKFKETLIRSKVLDAPKLMISTLMFRGCCST